MKDVAKPWMVKVLTDLGTRLLIVIKPQLLVKDLQGAIEHDHRAAYPGCGEVECQLLSVLEYEDGRDVPSSVHSRYRLQDVLRRDGARVYAEFLNKADKNTASLCNGVTPLQIGLSPHLTPSDPETRGTLTSPREPTRQHAALMLNGASLQASPAVGSKRSMGGAAEASQERAPKRARHGAQLGTDARQPDQAAAAFPSYPAADGSMAAGSQEEMQLHGASQHLNEAAAYSADKTQHGVQPDPALGLLQSHEGAKAASQSNMQLQVSQQRPPSPVNGKQHAQDLSSAQAAVEAPDAKGVQQNAKSESSSEEESSSDEGSPPGKGLPPSEAPAQQRLLASQPQVQREDQPPPQQQQQLQQQGASQPAAQGLQKAGEAQSSSGSEEESGSSSEDEDVQPDPLLSKSAALLRAPMQDPLQQSAKPGKIEEESSSEEESAPESESPSAQQKAAVPAPSLPAQHTAALQQAGLNGRAQDGSSSEEGDTESSEEERNSDPAAAQASKRAAQNQAKQGAVGAVKDSNSSSVSEEGSGTPDQAQQPDRALATGSKGAGPDLAQQLGSKAPAPQQHAPRTATPAENGGWGVPIAEASSSSEGAEGSGEDQSPHAAGNLGQVAASGRKAEEYPSAKEGTSGGQEDASASGSEANDTPRNGQRMVSQREYEMIQKIGEHDPEVIFKALLDAKSAKKQQEQAAKQTPVQAGIGNKSGRDGAGQSKRNTRQTAQQTADAGKDADVETATHAGSHMQPLSETELLDRAVTRATDEKKVLQQAKQKKEAENPFSKPFKKMTDPVALRKMLRKELPRLVGHEQGLDLPSSKKMFEYAKPPSWWQLDKWNDGQFDRTILVLQGIYRRAQEPWQSMQKALQ